MNNSTNVLTFPVKASQNGENTNNVSKIYRFTDGFGDLTRLEKIKVINLLHVQFDIFEEDLSRN